LTSHPHLVKFIVLMKPILRRGGTMREFGCINKGGIFTTFVYEVIYEK